MRRFFPCGRFGFRAIDKRDLSLVSSRSIQLRCLDGAQSKDYQFYQIARCQGDRLFYSSSHTDEVRSFSIEGMGNRSQGMFFYHRATSGCYGNEHSRVRRFPTLPAQIHLKVKNLHLSDGEWGIGKLSGKTREMKGTWVALAAFELSNLKMGEPHSARCTFVTTHSVWPDRRVSRNDTTSRVQDNILKFFTPLVDWIATKNAIKFGRFCQKFQINCQ